MRFAFVPLLVFPAQVLANTPTKQTCPTTWPVPHNFKEVESRLAKCPTTLSTYAVVNHCPKRGKVPGTTMCDRQLNDHLNGGDNH